MVQLDHQWSEYKWKKVGCEGTNGLRGESGSKPKTVISRRKEQPLSTRHAKFLVVPLTEGRLR